MDVGVLNLQTEPIMHPPLTRTARRMIVPRLIILALCLLSFLIAGCGNHRTLEPFKRTSEAVSGITEDEARIFLAKIQSAIDSPSQMAKLVRYPMEWHDEGKPDREIRTPREFAEGFAAIASKDFSTAIKQVDFRDLSYSWKGYNMCDGQMWFAKLGEPGTEKSEVIVITVIQPRGTRKALRLFKEMIGTTDSGH